MIYLPVIPITIIGAIFLYKIYSASKPNSKKPPENPPKYSANVIFFTAANVPCRKKCLPKQVPCRSDCSVAKLRKITNLFNNAKESIDICVYLITCYEISHAIIRAHKRGVKIRMIIDEEMSSSSESKISQFIREGIPVKSKLSNVLMHHKFCIIDHNTSDCKLLTGSLNWTLQGLAGNYEYVTILTHPGPTQAYENEFEELWKTFDLKRLR